MKNILFVFTFILSPFLSILAQSFEFSRLDISNGLSNNQVECVFKDSRGFMWFATNVGLNRYDGQNFRIYKHNKDNKNNPQNTPNDRFNLIQEDVNGNLWLAAADRNYVLYDWKNEIFTANTDSILNAMQLPPYPTLLKIDKAKNFYAYYSEKGIYKHDPHSGEIFFYEQSDNAQTLSRTPIIDFNIWGDYIWVLFHDGKVERIDTKQGIVDLKNSSLKEKFLSSTITKYFFVDADNDLWIYPGVADKGLAFFDTEKNEWQFPEKEYPALANVFIRSIVQDNEGLIWIGTDHDGIIIYDKKKNEHYVLKNDAHNKNSIGQNSIISLYADNNGIVWVGTYKNGISYYHKDMFKFPKTFLYDYANMKNEVFDCNTILRDSKGYVWIGTNGSGLIQYNAEKEQIRIYRNEAGNPHSLSSNIITALFEDEDKTLWIGTFLGGLNAFDGKQFTRYQIDENNSNSLSNKSVYGIAEDDTGNLWIGTLGSGIDKLDRKSKNFTHYNTVNNSKLYSDFILSMSTNSKGEIIVSTDRGVNIIDKEQGEIKPYFDNDRMFDSLTNLAANYAITDSFGNLWIATSSGINIYDPEKRQFHYLTMEDGLPNYEVVSLVEENSGKIWAGTRNGLAVINYTLEAGDFQYTISYYNTHNGLPGSSFNQNGVYKDAAGHLYFGLTNGYVAFDPKEITPNSYKPRLCFTELLVSNQVIHPNQAYNGRVVINQSITSLSEITLNYKETNFTLFFSSLDYVHSEKSRYKYRLEGLEEDWKEIVNGQGAASYSNLNPGTYRLLVYAANDDFLWNQTPLEMKITVRPPFWFSWWAYLIYLFIIAGLILLFMNYKLNKQKCEFEQAQKMLEINKVHEIDELKFKFFTNISHELKTPLTLILTPLETLLKSPASEEQKNMFTIMYKNATSLLNMVTEILDFRKFDLNKMTINKSTGEIISFIRDVCHSFALLATEKSLKFTFSTFIDELYMDFDAEKIKKIITNLLSNAFKYTKEGSIDVSVSIYEEMNSNASYISIKVADTGIGLEESEIEKIFERFYRIEKSQGSAHSGSGVGLHLANEYAKLHDGKIEVESKVNEGSVFTVLIPIKLEEYSNAKNRSLTLSNGAKKTDGNGENSNENPNETSAQELPILLVTDDNEDFCEFLKTVFSSSYRILVAHNGKEAHKLVLEHLPDIILCDVMMPEMDGYEFCRVVKGDIRTSHIPIILLTAKSSEESKYSGIEAGADDYISKPFNLDMLSLKMERIVDKQKNLHQNFKKKISISPSDIEITSLDEKFVKKAIEVVENNIGNSEFLVEDLCREMAMSRVYFYKKILSLTDKTPSEFIRFIRLKRAAVLLEKSQLFVNEIAYQVGFNDPKYFRKYFKEEFGLTPNEYKKKYTEE